jgi:hypothetical protein
MTDTRMHMHLHRPHAEESKERCKGNRSRRALAPDHEIDHEENAFTDAQGGEGGGRGRGRDGFRERGADRDGEERREREGGGGGKRQAHDAWPTELSSSPPTLHARMHACTHSRLGVGVAGATCLMRHVSSDIC